MELREIYNECQAKARLLNVIDGYFQRGEIPQDGKPYRIADPIKFFNIIALASAQAKAPEFEKYIALKTGWTKILASENRGDYHTPENKYIELKASFTNKANHLNIRQIRLWQPIDMYLIIYVNHNNLAESKVYTLTHQQMEDEVIKSGSATHGTAEANEVNNNIEYSITIPMNNGVKQQEWDSLYYNQELFNLIFGG